MMNFSFQYEPNPFILWKLTMRSIYRSMAGVCNIIFTISMILLLFRFWGNASLVVKVLLVSGIGLFTILQPVAIYIKEKSQLERNPENMRIEFSNEGIEVTTRDQSSFVKWGDVNKIVKSTSSIIIFTSNSRGLLLTDDMLKDQKEELYNFILEHTQ